MHSWDGTAADARESMRAAVRSVLIDHALSQSELARQLTDAAQRYELKRGESERELRYDPAMINRWLDGKLIMGRQAAWLLDHTFARPLQAASFQDLRDSYVLAADREQVPDPVSVSVGPMLEGARCSAELLAQSRRRRPLELRDGEQLFIYFLAVVDCGESRHIVADYEGRTDGVRLIAMYDLMGNWDLAVMMAVSPAAGVGDLAGHLYSELAENGMTTTDSAADGGAREFTRHRSVLVNPESIRAADGSADPRFLVLESQDQYDLFRVQRSFLFIELDALPALRSEIARNDIKALIAGDDFPESCLNAVEAVIEGEDCVIIELVSTCANGMRRINQINRVIGRELTRFRAQKYALLSYYVDERGWQE